LFRVDNSASRGGSQITPCFERMIGGRLTIVGVTRGERALTSSHSNSWTKAAIQVAGAGLGAAIAGPLGGALGGWLGVTLGGSAAALAEKCVDKFGESGW
jgi:hypothetical protein